MVSKIILIKSLFELIIIILALLDLFDLLGLLVWIQTGAKGVKGCWAGLDTVAGCPVAMTTLALAAWLAQRHS